MKKGDVVASRYIADHVLSLRGPRQTWVGYRIADNVRVVIETLHDSLIHDTAAVGSLRYQLELSARLPGPYFAHPLESVVDENRLYVIWEYIDAQPLTNNKSLANIAPRDMILFIVALVKGISQAHQARVVHGALSTDCILITPDLLPIYIDFPVPGSVTGTDPGTGAGVSAYAAAAPEIKAGRPLTSDSDLYSLGVIAGYLLDIVDPGFASGSIDSGFRDPVIPTPIRSAISLLRSYDAPARTLTAQDIISPAFIDIFATPPHGIDAVVLSKSQARRIKNELRNNENEKQYSTVSFILIIRVIVIVAAAVGSLAVINHYIQNM